MKNQTHKRWTEQEIELLNTHWPVASTKQKLFEIFPDRNINSLMGKAKQLGLKCIVERNRNGSLDFLNTLTKKSLYWWGFIMADGHITRKGDLVITLSIKEKEHLLKLARYLGRDSITERTVISTYTKKEATFCTLRIGDKIFANKWLDILNIHSAKTYTPPNLEIFLTKENLIYFFLGFIDGDGSIWLSRNKPVIGMQIHGNWFDTLSLISQRLKEFYDINSYVRMTKTGYCKLDIHNQDGVQKLKSYSNEVDYLERKWSKIGSHNVAMKATYVEVDETIGWQKLANSDKLESTIVEPNIVGREIFKDPITDDGTKKSATGLLRIDHDDILNRYALKDKCTKEEELYGELQLVFQDSTLFIDEDLDTIRKRLKS